MKLFKKKQVVFSHDKRHVRFERPTPEELGIELNAPRELYVKQIDTEFRGREERYAFLMDSFEKASERGSESQTEYGSLLIGKKVMEYASAIEEVATERKRGTAHTIHKLFEHDLDYGVIANIALTTVVERITREQGVGTLAMTIARTLEDEINFNRLACVDEKASTMAARNMKKKSRYSGKHASLKWWTTEGAKLEWFTWPDSVRMAIGQGLLSILQVKLEWFNMRYEVRHTGGRTKRAAVITPSEQLMHWIDEARKEIALTLRPCHEPMLVPPVQWSSNTLMAGGYLTRANRPLPMVKTHNKAYLRELRNADMPDVYEALNLIQETPFAVNGDVLSMLQDITERQYKQASSLKLPVMHKRELSDEVRRSPDVDSNPEALYWYQKSCEEFQRDEKIQAGKRLTFFAMLSMAERYSHADEFYNPWQGDTRFRVYPATKFNCQGVDSTKALLHYAEPMPLGEHGLKWLGIGITGLFGVDKVTLPERMQWVEDHKQDIIQLATKPYDAIDFWKTADKPMQAYAYAREMAQAWSLKDPSKFLSRLSVPLDGSCSGLQMLGMALACEDTGKHVNLLPADKPADIYGVIAMVVKAELENLVAGRTHAEIVKASEEATYKAWRKIYPYAPYVSWLNCLDDVRETGAVDGATKKYMATLSKLRNVYFKLTEAYAWLQFGLDRKTVKRNVMTYCYGSGQFGFADQIREDIVAPAYKEHKRKIAQGLHSDWYFHGAGRRAAQTLASYVYPAVKRTVVRAAQAMEWLQAVAKLIASSGRPVCWTTLLGFPVMQDYHKKTRQRINCKMLGMRNDLTISKDAPEFDAAKAATAVSPNFVHSLDSTHLLKVVLLAFRKYGIRHFSLVHDSFATHAGKTEELFKAIREAMVEMFTKHDVFAELYKEFETQVPPEKRHLIPPLPTYGKLDRHAVLDSSFAFL